MAKLNRENAVLERRARKQAKKDARKQAAAAPPSRSSETPTEGDDEPRLPTVPVIPPDVEPPLVPRADADSAS